MISIRYYVHIHHKKNIRRYDVCSFGSRSNPEIKASVYKTDRRKRLATCVLRTILVGCMNAHQCDAIGRQGKKLHYEHLFFLAIKTKAPARQWGRERSACHVTPDLRCEREGA